MTELIPIVDNQQPVIDDFRGMTTVSSCKIDDIEKFEKMIYGSSLNMVDAMNEEGLEEKLVGNMYCRKLLIPQGTFLTGKIHKRPYLDIFIYGDVTVKSFCHDGVVESSTRINHFQFLNGKPGRKRVLYAHKETMWLTVDPAEIENIEDAEKAITCLNLADYCKELK